MRRVTGLVSAAAIVMLAAGVYAQGKDFSGKWTVDAEKTAAANPAPAAGARMGGGGGGGDLTITMDAKMLTLERAGRQGGPAPTPMKYNLDGTESKNTVTMGQNGPMDQLSTAKWDGNTLVITTKGTNGDTVAKYSLDGANLKVETTAPGRNGAAPTPRTTFYKKG